MTLKKWIFPLWIGVVVLFIVGAWALIWYLYHTVGPFSQTTMLGFAVLTFVITTIGFGVPLLGTAYGVIKWID